MQKMLRARPPWPVDDVAAMIRRVVALPAASQKKLTPAFRRRVDELRISAERGGGALTVSDPDYAEFLKTHSDAGASDNNTLADLKTRRAFSAYKLKLAQVRGDLGGIKDATDALKMISSVIYDEEMLAQKLGREIGDQIPKEEAERIARAIAFWLLRCVDEIHLAVCKPIADASASGPLFPEEVRAHLDPVLLDTRVFQPIVRALQSTSALKLPAWFVDAFRAGLSDVIEDAVDAFAKLYATPPPPPAPLPSAPPAP